MVLAVAYLSLLTTQVSDKTFTGTWRRETVSFPSRPGTYEPPPEITFVLELTLKPNHKATMATITVRRSVDGERRIAEGTWKRTGTRASVTLPSRSMDFRYNDSNHSLDQVTNGRGTWIKTSPPQIVHPRSDAETLVANKWRSERMTFTVDASGRRFDAYDQLEFLSDGTVISSELLASDRSTQDQHPFTWKILPGKRLLLEGQWITTYRIEGNRLILGSNNLAHFPSGKFVRG